MRTANELKSQTTTLKRTITTLYNIVDVNRLHQRSGEIHVMLNEKELAQLERSVAILNKYRAKTAKAAINLITQEKAKRIAIDKACVEATSILVTWPEVCSVLDKAAFIIGDIDILGLQYHLEHAGINYDYVSNFNRLFNEAIQYFPTMVALYAVNNNKSVIEVMATASMKLMHIKSLDTTQDLVRSWQLKMNQTAIVAE